MDYSSRWLHAYALAYTYDKSGRRLTLKPPTGVAPSSFGSNCTQTYAYVTAGAG